MIDELRTFYQNWCKSEHLGLASADDFLAGSGLTEHQRDWLVAFIPLWDLTQAGDDMAYIAMRAPDPEEGPE